MAVPPRPTDAYGQTVYDENPDLYWRLNEAAGPTAQDASPNISRGTYAGDVTYGAASTVTTAPASAVTFNGTTGSIGSDTQFSNPTVYSEELWFKTATTAGGKLIGFGDAKSGLSNNYDRHLYMDDDREAELRHLQRCSERHHLAGRLQRQQVAPRGGDSEQRRHAAVR